MLDPLSHFILFKIVAHFNFSACFIISYTQTSVGFHINIQLSTSMQLPPFRQEQNQVSICMANSSFAFDHP